LNKLKKNKASSPVDILRRSLVRIMNAYKAANTNDGDKKKGAAAASAGKAGDAAAGERSGSGNANSNVDDETAEPKKMIRFTDE